VDVVVPVLDGGDGLKQCLRALAAQTAPHRVIVADNGSTDGSIEVARHAGATVVHEPVRSSYAARNRALGEVTADVVAFTDADCIPRPTWLAEGLAVLAGSGADLVAGRVVMSPGRSAAARHDAVTYLNQELQVAHGMAATANLLVRTGVFDQVGQFRAELRSGGDTDFVARCVAAGMSLVYADAAVVEHPPRDTLRAVLKKAWRIGVGHGELAAAQESQRHWLSYRHAMPSRSLLRSGDAGVIAVDMIVKGTAQLARWSAFARDRATRRTLYR
jgi:glycosyltransferase involved in cell wall biosynthesis